MANRLLSLKWNNHKITFFQVLSNIRQKESYTDVTIACDGKFYSLHKFVLSTCSEYFEEMFEKTNCKNPVIVLKDITSEELEALLNYMYVGEVNVEQEKLSGLIKAAECLKIKGLAVPDEDPAEDERTLAQKRPQRSEESPTSKRRKKDNDELVSNTISKYNTRTSLQSNSSENITKPIEVAGPSEFTSTNNDVLDDGSNHDSFSEVTEDIKPEPVEYDESFNQTEEVPSNIGEDSKDALQKLVESESERSGDVSLTDPPKLLGSDEKIPAAEELEQMTSEQNSSFSMWEGTEGSELGDDAGEGSSSVAGTSQQMNATYFRAMRTEYLDKYKYKNKNDSICVCDKCDFKTNSKTRLIEHLRKHTGEKPLECPYCCKKFAYKNSLLRHIRIHTDEKQHACPHCPYKGTEKRCLRLHLQKIHNESS